MNFNAHTLMIETEPITLDTEICLEEHECPPLSEHNVLAKYLYAQSGAG
jgi:hypothetical protein